MERPRRIANTQLQAHMTCTHAHRDRCAHACPHAGPPACTQTHTHMHSPKPPPHRPTPTHTHARMYTHRDRERGSMGDIGCRLDSRRHRGGGPPEGGSAGAGGSQQRWRPSSRKGHSAVKCLGPSASTWLHPLSTSATHPSAAPPQAIPLVYDRLLIHCNNCRYAILC
jgi:hypothetical protein